MKAFYLAVLTALIWGIVPALEKVGLSRLSPYAGMVFRCVGVMIGASFIIVVKPEIIKEASSAGMRGLYLFIIAGFLANFVAQLLFYNALKEGDVSIITPVAGSYPLISFFLGILIFQEAVTIPKLLGVLLVISGLYLLKG